MTAEQPTFGPVQMLVLEFDRARFEGDILPELERLKRSGIIRLIDLLFVRRPHGGELEVVQTSDLSPEEATDFGAIVGPLVGLGAGSEPDAARAAAAGADELEEGHFFGDTEVWYLADAIPEGKSAAIALIEHTWAIELRDRIRRAGGTALADEWIHPADLVAIGAGGSTDLAAIRS
jgi:uncharacterized membrane protein